MRPRLGRRTRVGAALSAVAAAIVVAAVVAGAGSAKGTPTTLHLVGTIQKTIGFAPDHPPRQGDRFGGGSEITGDDGLVPASPPNKARPPSSAKLSARTTRDIRLRFVRFCSMVRSASWLAKNMDRRRASGSLEFTNVGS